MLDPKWVIAMGDCASCGGILNNYAVMQGADEVVPVNVYIGGNPPRLEA
jgi:NADH-quinone oxidoreductase subunit B